MAQIAVHVSLSSKGYEPLVCAHALFALLGRRSARAPLNLGLATGDGLSSCMGGVRAYVCCCSIPGMGP
jgi:hypothetical protein